MQTFVGKVMSLLFNMLSRFVIAFLPKEQVSFNFMPAVTIHTLPICIYNIVSSSLGLSSTAHSEPPSRLQLRLEILSHMHFAFRDSSQLPFQKDTIFSLKKRNWSKRKWNIRFCHPPVSKHPPPLHLSIIIHQAPASTVASIWVFNGGSGLEKWLDEGVIQLFLVHPCPGTLEASSGTYTNSLYLNYFSAKKYRRELGKQRERMKKPGI